MATNVQKNMHGNVLPHVEGPACLIGKFHGGYHSIPFGCLLLIGIDGQMLNQKHALALCFSSSHCHVE